MGFYDNPVLMYIPRQTLGNSRRVFSHLIRNDFGSDFGFLVLQPVIYILCAFLFRLVEPTRYTDIASI